MFKGFTVEARRIVFFARAEAMRLGSAAIEPEHFLVALVEQYPQAVDQLISGGKCTASQLQPALAATLDGLPKGNGSAEDIPFSWESIHLIRKARQSASRHRHDWIGIEHLLLALLSYPTDYSRFFARRVVPKQLLRKLGVRKSNLATVLESLKDPFANQARHSESAI